MLTFKCPEDISKLPTSDPAFPLVRELIKELIEAYTWEGHPYNPDWYGYIILIEPEDVDRELDELWDGCTLQSRGNWCPRSVHIGETYRNGC